MPNGTVVRFSRRFGYGFVAPDDGGDDVFVHQNNINMEGFRFLQVGERVSYELEVGEKGMKAVSVALTEPRVQRAGRDDQQGEFGDQPRQGGEQQDQRDRGDRGDRGEQAEGNGHGEGGEYRAPRQQRQQRPPRANRAEGDSNEAQKLRRKLERLITLLVEKGVLLPGEIDGLDGSSPAKSIENQQA